MLTQLDSRRRRLADEFHHLRTAGFVVMRSGSDPTPEALIAYCKARIAGYKCPQSVDFRAEPFPLSAAGKVLKRDLRAPYWAQQ